MKGGLLMGLFSRKKTAEAKPSAVIISAEKSKEFDSSPNYSMGMDSDEFFRNQEHKSVKGPKSIRQSTIENSLAQMEAELSNRPEPLDYRAYDKNPVRERELERLSGEFEAVCDMVREKESRTRYKYIQNAVVTDIDARVEKLRDMYDYLTDDSFSRDTAEFSEAVDDESLRCEQEKDMAMAERRERAKSIMPSLTQAQKTQIEEFSESEIRAKPIDFENEIPSLSSSDIDALAARFEEKYGALESVGHDGGTEGAEVMSKEDEEDLKRLRAIFG